MFLPHDVVKRLRPKTPSQNGVMGTCRHCDVLNSVKCCPPAAHLAAELRRAPWIRRLRRIVQQLS